MIYKSLILLFFFYLSINAHANSCGNYLLFNKKILPTDETAFIEADKSSIENKNIFNLIGNASIASSDFYVNADNISYNKELKTSNSIGNVKFHDDSILLKSDNLKIKQLNDKDKFIQSSNATFSIPENNIRGFSNFIEGNSSIKTLSKARYTNCQLGNSDWEIYADKIILNSNTNRGNGENVTLYLFGLPIIYSPYIDWVLEGKGSGFLAPSISSYSDNGSTNKGYSVEIPYFLNIAPDRDLLLSVQNLTTRGGVLSAKYRQLIYDSKYWKNGKLESKFSYLNNDKIRKDNRWFLDNKLNLTVNNDTRFELVNKRVSDIDYFRDIELEGVSRDSLLSYLNIARNQPFYNFKFYSESEQKVNTGTDDYTKKPEIEIYKSLDLQDNNSFIDYSFTSTHFDHKNKNEIQGLRNNIFLKYSKEYENLAYEITPSIFSFNSFYNLDNDNVALNNIGAQLTSKFFLEREFNFLTKNLVQTLVPVFSYTYIPKTNQSEIPNFDTAIESSSYYSIFSANSFTGKDKVSNQNSITLGLESDFFDDNTGDTYLSLKAGQKFYFDDVNINLNGNFEESNILRRGYSNIFTLIDFNYKNFELSNSIQYDPEINKVESSKVVLKYLEGPKHFISLSYADESDEDHLQISTSYQLNSDNHIFFNLNRNLSQNINDRLTTGFAMENCCLSYRFAFFKKHLSNNDYSYNKAFELVFKGLSSTTPSLKARLESEIPNYIGDLNSL